jgi:5-formyltetrahydrofolate cyclo-ligase
VTDKAALRLAAAVRREQAYAEVDQHPAVERLDDELKPFAGHAISFYMPMRAEIDPRPAMVRAVLRGPALLPVTTRRGRPLLFRRWQPGTPMVRDGYGVEHPDDAQEPGMPEVLVVPLLAFDGAGHRLGYGGGYYDRTLAWLRGAGPVTAIGFAFAAQEVERLPKTEWDQPLDGVVTESEVRWFH